MVVLTQSILDNTANYVGVTELTFLTVGEGNDPIALDTTDLETPVQIGASDRNKAIDSVTITDNFFEVEWIITAPEPETQPVNLSEVGVQSGLNVNDDLKLGFPFFASTKDNASQWRVRLSGRVIEGA